MPYYLVKAKPLASLTALKEELDSGGILRMKPFGTALDYSLKNARQAADQWVTWEEEDYCSPPLSMERSAVLDRYFDSLSVTKVEKGDGWKQIESLPGVWKETLNG
jgi:hypothetical protein